VIKVVQKKTSVYAQNIGILRILQQRQFTGVDPGFSRRGPSRPGPLEAEAKCEISVKFFMFTCSKFTI